MNLSTKRTLHPESIDPEQIGQRAFLKHEQEVKASKQRKKEEPKIQVVRTFAK